MGLYLFSAWYRNGEDLIFYEPEFNRLAYAIATGKHTFELELSVLGWHLIFTAPAHILTVTIEYGPGLTGDAKIVTR